MKESQKNILYFTRTMKLGGTEKVILQLCEIMKSKTDKIIVCSCGGVNVEKLNKLGIKHYHIPDIEKKDIKTILTTLKVVSKIMKEENINIVHTHHRMAAFYSRIIGFTKKFISINNAHNTFSDKKWLTKFALKNTNIIAVGNNVKKNLCDFYGIPKAHVEVIHNAIKQFTGPVELVELLQKYRNKGYFLVGNIGRLSEQKGMEYFIQSIPMVLKECSKVKFFIVGDGEYKDKIEKLICDLNLHNEVILLGYRNDIQNIMSQLDLIVLSSLWEGFPLTPIEAFSVGKTIVATSVDGTVEIVDNGINGILVQPGDSKEIANGIIEMYNFPEKMKRFENSGYEKYKVKFSYDLLQDMYRKFYKELME